ncbi:MAG: prepilin-type N-terminal cleavage/methylation domain-containing protein [Bacilli bacterium]|nr:prepilin-type N-terminal cleavage/methylation domain-containing protein [Bacilli bacterium]
MNKKGFTLVELLAVIAILAILVIIALPNVLNLFNDAKKNSFQTEVQTIYNTAQQEFLLGGGKAVEYYRNNGVACAAENTTFKTLSLKGTSTVDYYIKIDPNGNIVEYHVADDAFAFTYTGTTGLKVEEIGETEKPIIVLADQPTEGNKHTAVVSAINGKCTTTSN